MQTPWLTIVGEVGDRRKISFTQVEEAIGPLAQPGHLNGSDGYARTGVPANEHIRLRTN